MPVLGASIWGCMTCLVMATTIKYYLPVLAGRTKNPASEAWAFPFLAKAAIGVFCIIYACLCGWKVCRSDGSIINFVKMTAAFGVLSAAFVTDIAYMLIPNALSLTLIAVRIVTAIGDFIWFPGDAMGWIVNSIVALVLCVVILCVASRLAHGGMGMGDIKLFAGLGFLCGVYAVIYTLVFAFIACSLVSLGLLLFRKKGLKDSLPMGPFIWFGYGVGIILAVV